MNTGFQDKMLLFFKEYWETLPNGIWDDEEYYATPKGHFEREIVKFLNYHQIQRPDWLIVDVNED